MTGQDHNRLLWIFFAIQGGLQLFGGILVVLIYGGFGLALAGAGPDEEALAVGGIMVVFSLVAGFFALLFAGFYAFTVVKMKNVAPVGKTLGIIASCIALLGFPLGTALGIYGLWFFFGDASKEVYGGGARLDPPPPPPNNWQ